MHSSSNSLLGYKIFLISGEILAESPLNFEYNSLSRETTNPNTFMHHADFSFNKLYHPLDGINILREILQRSLTKRYILNLLILQRIIIID